MSKLNVKPLADRVLIESEEAETKTASGIYIPDSAQEKPQQGKVVAVGSGTKDIEMELKVGDTVLYGKYSGSEITVDGNDYVIMHQSDVFLVL
ncbi:MAG: co-chaperone GroES [Bacteroidetes bacterium]|nr:co-chaperone GroES [Bacteroidota bacterium]